MKKSLVFILSLLLLLSGPFSAANANAASVTDSVKVGKVFHLDKKAKFKAGEVIVKFKDQLSDKTISSKIKSFSAQQKGEIESIKANIISVPQNKNIEEFINELLKDPNVEYAQPNYLYHTFSNPTDPSFGQQWYLSKVKAPDAWNTLPANAADVVVAVVDNGVDVNHPDLKNNILLNNYYNAVNPSVSIDATKTNGHGTEVAGIIGATINNNIGIAGVSPKVKIMPINVFNGEEASETDLVEGISYAVDHGAKVINLSLGTYGYGYSLKEAIDYAYQKNVVVVAAAGNDNIDLPTYPASYANVISVGATDNFDKKADFSNYGSTVDIVAPGVNIYSTAPNNQYKFDNGTSMASPIVAGAAALLLAKNPNLTVDEVTNILLKSSLDIGPKGVDDTFGYGRLDIANAMVTASTYTDDQWESNDSFSTAKAITLGGSIKASLSKPKDVDYFKVTLSKPQRVRFRLTPQLDEDLILQVYDGSQKEIIRLNSEGIPIGDEYYEGGIEEFNLSLNAGTYYLKVTDPNSSMQFGSYTLTTYYPVSTRIAGNNRFETAVKVSQNGWQTANTVILAYYNGFADALAGAPLAYQKDAPILLTESQKLTTATKTEIQRLKAKNIIIVGGTGVISTAVENELKLNMKLNVTRLGGKDRFATAKLIAGAMGKTDTAVVAYGFNFPDALAIAPYAAINGYPILLVDKNTIPAMTKEALSVMGIRKTVIIGGTGVVSDGVSKQLPSPSRISGKDRFSTATEIIRRVNEPTEKVYVATGMNYADALTGAVLAAKNNAPLLLTMPNELPTATRDISLERNILNFTILGGTGAVSNQVLTELLK
ncbi:S8 family serine peptidase [Tepidibacillus fermentans]|uniref:Putative cell wall-binding protein n=1 Tax=Tepidibacillus fermentans TaxID=1281767 RepID=A0A4R3KIG0_9BACI|nr:S8 family serine peptidase [Tepidibacillus fermentans]TCS83346.1 putative cell wall-binding protein [Tepidibacillus fermentans]